MELPASGLYRTTQGYPGHEGEIPPGVLVYVGVKPNGGVPFVVRPGGNRNNRWYWAEPTQPLRALNWAGTLVKLRSEGFYVLPRELSFDTGGRWIKGAIVQLGYNSEGRGILFVAEQHDDEERNVLIFGDSGRVIDDELLEQLIWAPILPVRSQQPPED